MIARMLMAGPAKRNVVAGPMPLPFLRMPANIGRMVQLQTARIVPDTDAIP